MVSIPASVPVPIPASVLQRIRDGAAVIVVAPGAAPWSAAVAAIVDELAGLGVTVVDGAPGDAAALMPWLEALRAACAVRPAGGPQALIEELLARVEATDDPGERARGLREVAAIYETEFGDPARAFAAIVTACRLEPDDDATAQVAARLAAQADRWDELVGEATQIARTVADDGKLAARWSTRAGDWYATRLGDLEAAIQAYEAAAEVDPGAIAALEALIELYDETGSTDELRGTVIRLTAAIQRHAGHPRATDVWAKLGAVAGTLGDPRAAEAAYRRVIEREPLHAAARAALVELAAARGEWRGVIDLHHDELDALAGVPDSAARRARLHEQIGDLWSGKLQDPGAAIAAYEQAATRGALHKLLEVFMAQRRWPRALEALDRLAAEEPAADRRARFHYAAAVIARDELDDAARAIAELTLALDDAPETPGAFDALDALLAARGDGGQRVRAFRRQLTRLADGAPAAVLELWLRLADVCVALGDHDTAIAAYQVACELAPGDAAQRERLTELYLEAGAPRRRDAIAELQALIARAPERVELYKALSELYADEGEADAAWCVAQVLVLLGAASPDESRRFARGVPRGLAPMSRKLTDEHWRAIAHPAEDPRIGAVFELAGAAIARDTAQPIAAFGLDGGAPVDVLRDGRAASRLLHQVVRGLAIEPAPLVWFDRGDDLRLANTLAGDRPVPALLVGDRALARLAPRDLAFAAGKRLAYLRPERFVAFAVATVPGLEAAFAAVTQAAGGELAQRLRARLAAPVLDQLAERARGVDGGGVAAWRAATDLTANRAGLVIANDLDAAARAIAIEGTTFSGRSAKERIRDLLGFAVSDAYLAVRRHLGQRLADETVARTGEA